MARLYELTDLQVDILRILWQRGGAAASEIVEELRPGRRLAHSTVATLLARLVKRGIVHHTSAGRGYVYYASITEEQVRRSMMSRIVRAFSGEAAAMVNQLLDETAIDPEELQQLRRTIDERLRESREQ